MRIKLFVRAGCKPAYGRILPYILTLFIGMVMCTNAYGQDFGSSNGTIIDAKGSPVEFATIALQDSLGKNLKGVLTDSMGSFSFKSIPYGFYKIQISNMGFKTHTTPVFRIHGNKKTVVFIDIQLLENVHTLNAVGITVQKKVIEQSLDKMTINVENSILAEGNTALELLQRAPGVKVDDEGKISLKGRTGVTVMINNKLTYLSPAELATLLKGTNSSSIAKIEIISNPSSKYDAAGNAGMINLVLKKNMMKGLNSSFSLNGGSGRNARYGSGGSLNYKNGKLNLFGSYNYAYRGETEYLDFTRLFYQNGMNSTAIDRTSNQHTKTNEPLHTNNFRVGADLDLDTCNTLSLLITGNIGSYVHDALTTNQITSNLGNLITDMSTTNYDRQNWENISYGLSYLRKFEKEGRELSADLDYAQNSFTSNLNLNTSSFATDTNPIPTLSSRKGFVPAKTNVYTAKVDFVDSWSNGLKFETGLKSAFVASDNNLIYHTLVNEDWLYDENASNHFKYEEQIHAGYVNMKTAVSNYNLQLGLRGEYTHTLGNQVTSNTTFKRNYFQLFSNLSIDKAFADEHRLQLTYGRRVQRPDYGDLNPFRVFRDPLLYYQGNLNLKPEFTQNLALNYILKGKYTTSLAYSNTKDVITWITGQVDNINTTFESPQNLKALINYGISFTAQTDYFSWWTATNFANVFSNRYEGDATMENFDNSLISFSLNSQNNFKAGKGYSFELNGYLNSRSVYGTAIEQSYYAISAAVQKTLLKEKASLKLLINDIFQSSQYKMLTRYQNINMNSHVNADSRRLILSFSYRFGGSIAARDRKSGNEDELNRLKGTK